MSILCGDCLSVLKTMDPNYIDSLVTDPPAGISFMGKAWDDDKGGRKQWIAWMTEVMAECLRVMKPGAHGLVWAIPRTSHWTATALEDAGFEIRDVVTHLFGSGFPKSLDISKAIDKAAGVEREVVGKLRCKNIKGGNLVAQKEQIQHAVTAPSTAAAKQWSGWGTALKPASEHWILVRKPCSEKTVAANVLKWGVGGINVDGCRISVNADDPNKRRDTGGYASIESKAITKNAPYNSTRAATLTTGRFPANLVLSCSPNCTEDAHDMFDCPIAIIDEQSGVSKSSKLNCVQSARTPKSKGRGRERERERIDEGYSDIGGASRFFYCAKASKSDKGANNSHPTVKSTKLMQYLIRMITPHNGLVLDPFTGSGSTGVAAVKEGFGFVGIEQNKEYVEIAEKRIGALTYG